ncbi:MAG: bifunctional (p)ppGpp synthetase/guanosine-3',5'-bis(diphosphate) 3'-pyrophosphohydrolase [Hyphomicrobiaceae bacterium]
MMRQYELTERVLNYNPDADEALLNRAYVYAMKAHGQQKRASGDPYFSHPLEVAAILTELKLDDATIATALLHDTIEDTSVTRAEIDQLFGHEIGQLVEGLTKIRRLDLVSKKAQQAESFRKLLIAISSDVRVLLVKLADRLHNMRTLEHNSAESRRRNSEETLEIYAPLAGRMGMQRFREELEDLSFKWLYPDAHATVTAKLKELHERNEGLVQDISTLLKGQLSEAGIKADVTGREKKPYSIWRKMENKQISLEQLSDIYGFRVLVDTVDTCYRTIGVAHGHWRAVPGRFKDYVSTPKQNNYQSIHTTIVGPKNQRVEMQIRTFDMHRVAEVGIAAHALYKDKLDENGVVVAANGADVSVASVERAQTTMRRAPDGAPAKDNPYLWLRHMVEVLLHGNNSEEFLEHTKLELFHDQVFCFTPKGRIIALPRGATPIDFAYGVHTDVGNSCVGAIVNGRQLPLTTALRNGDEVEVLTAKGQVPPAAWEQIAITGRARASIRRALRDEQRRQYAELGRRLLVSGAAKAGYEFSDEKLRRVVSKIGQRTIDETFAIIGRGELPLADVLKAMFPDLVVETAGERARLAAAATDVNVQADEGWFNLAKVIGLKFRMPGQGKAAKSAPIAAPVMAGSATSVSEAMAVGGVSGGTLNGSSNGDGQAVAIRSLRNDIPVHFETGGAVPGDRIVGVLGGGDGIRIFQMDSEALKHFEHERWIDVRWDIDPKRLERFPARLVVTVLNVPGTLAEVAKVIGEADGNIDNLHMTRRAQDFTEMSIEVEVFDLVHLNQIIAGLKAKDVVSGVERVFG